MSAPAFRRRIDGTLTLCDPLEPGTDAPLVTCRGMEPTARERADAVREMDRRRRQVVLFGGGVA